MEEEKKKKKSEEDEIIINGKISSSQELESFKEAKDVKLKEISKNNFKTLLYG